MVHLEASHSIRTWRSSGFEQRRDRPPHIGATLREIFISTGDAKNTTPATDNVAASAMAAIGSGEA
jgi:hypothetical protein